MNIGPCPSPARWRPLGPGRWPGALFTPFWTVNGRRVLARDCVCARPLRGSTGQAERWDIGRNEVGAQAHQPDGVPPSTLLESGVSADLGNDDGVHVAQVYRWSAEETADLLGPWMAGRMHRRHHGGELVGL